MPYRHIAVLFVLVFLLYLPSINGPFILDDSHTIATNTGIQSLTNLGKIWTSGEYYSSQPSNWGYRPLTTTSNAVMWWIGGGQAWPFHLFKIALFTVLLVLLCRIWRILLPKHDQALTLATLLFAIHPAHTQIVCYIAATSSLLTWTCVLAAILYFLKYYDSRSAAHLSCSLLWYFLSMMAKEEGIVALALVGMTYAYLQLTRGQPVLSWKGARLAAAYTAVAMAGLALIVLMFEPTSDIARGHVTRLNYFFTQWRAYLHYLSLLAIPVGLNADNLEFGFSTGFWDWMVISALLMNLLIFATAIFYLPRRPLVTLCLAWFYVAISPSSSIVVLAEPVNDHRAFGGYFGIFGLIVVFLNFALKRNRPATLAVAGLVGLTFAGLTFKRADDWSSNEKIWADTVKKNPTSPRAANNLAVEYMGQARYAEALEALEPCRTTGSRYAHCFINRAVTLAALGKDIQATMEFERALEVDIDRISSRVYFADFLANRGFVSRPLELYAQADQFAKGRNLKSRVGLISLTSSSGDLEAARALWREAVEIHGLVPSLGSLAAGLKLNVAGQAQ